MPQLSLFYSGKKEKLVHFKYSMLDIFYSGNPEYSRKVACLIM